MLPRFKPFHHYSDLNHLVSCFKHDLADIENVFCEVMNVKYALFLSYGRAAIYLFLKSMKVENRKIIMPAYSCQAVIGPILETGNTPLFIDSKPFAFGMNDHDAIAAIDDKTAVLIPTAMYGYPIDIDVYNSPAAKSNTMLTIADYALGLHTFLNQSNVLETFNTALFSFGISKEMSFMGGGMITTNHKETYITMKQCRDHEFLSPPPSLSVKSIIHYLAAAVVFNKYLYTVLYYLSEKTAYLNELKGIEIGFKKYLPDGFYYLPDRIKTSLGLSHLKHLACDKEEKRRILNRYAEELGPFHSDSFTLPDYHNVLSHFPVLVTDRDSLMKYLISEKYHCTNMFKIPLHRLPYTRDLDAKEYPNATALTEKCLLLPYYCGLTEKDQMKVIHSIKQWLKSRR